MNVARHALRGAARDRALERQAVRRGDRAPAWAFAKFRLPVLKALGIA